MFKRSAIALMLICPSLFAHELTSFEAITNHLNIGKEIVTVLNQSHCIVEDPNEFKIPQSTITMAPSSVLFTDKLLSFDGVKFVHGRPPLPSIGILQRGSIILDSQGHANITLAFFEAESNKKIPGFNNVTIHCELGDGVHVYKK